MGEMADAIRESTATIVDLRAENARLQERVNELEQYTAAKKAQREEAWQDQVDRAARAEALAERRMAALEEIDCRYYGSEGCAGE